MIPNLMEDYILHIQQYESMEVGVLQLAVLSEVECMHTYVHHGKLESGVLTKVATRFINTGNEDIVSLLSYLPCRVTTDVEHFSAKSERDVVDFVHHDGEMYEIIPSSDQDSEPKEQTDHSDVKQDITKKRKTVLANSHACIQFTADRNFYSADDLYCESIISVNILSSMVSQQHPQMVYLCRHLTSKVLCDPFVNSSGSHFDEISIFWSEKHLCKYPASNLTDNWLTTFSICTPKGPQLDKHDKGDVFLEETLSGIQMSLSVIEYCDHLKCKMRSEQQGDCVQLLEKTTLELESSANKLAGSSQLLSINVEGFQRSSINEPSFMKVNTEGLTERKSETVCDLLEFPTKGQQSLTMLVHYDCQMNKFELSMNQLMSCKLQTTEYTEVQALETEKHFMQTVAMSLQVPNLKEEKSVCSAVLLAVCGLHEAQLRPNELDHSLPWDPVTKSARNADKTEDMSTESFFHCRAKNVDHKLHTFTNDKLQKFTLGVSFNDENVSVWYKAACSSSSNTILNPVVNNNKQITTKVKQKTERDDQHTGSSLEDFLLLRRGHMTEAVRPKRNDEHPSMPYAKSDMRGHTLKLIGSERITQASNLLLLLESRHNIEILECNYKELYQDSVFLGLGEPYYADVCVDERIGIVLHDFCNLRDSVSLEALTRRLAKLSLQYCSCSVILLCYPRKSNMVYPDDHDGQTVSNTALLHEAVSQFSTTANNFDIKIHYSDSDIATADLVHSITHKACQITSRDEKDWLQRSWLKLQLTQHEKLLMRVPCITPFTAQLMSSTSAPLSYLLAMSLPSLIQLCPWIPHKILELFVEFSREIPSISAGHTDSYNETAFYEPKIKDEKKQKAMSVECDHIAACWKSRTLADQLEYDEQEILLHHYTQDILIKENMNPHAHQTDASSHTEDSKIAIQENESRNDAEMTEQYGWKLGHSPLTPHINSECNDDFIVKYEGDEQVMFRLDKYPAKYYSTSSEKSKALSKRDEVNKISKSNQIATMSQTNNNSLTHKVCSPSSDWRHQEETYFDNMKGMHQQSESVLNDTYLGCGVVPGNQQRLTYERIPGARDGQTRLTFI